MKCTDKCMVYHEGEECGYSELDINKYGLQYIKCKAEEYMNDHYNQ